jgi:hypothetical protein
VNADNILLLNINYFIAAVTVFRVVISGTHFASCQEKNMNKEKDDKEIPVIDKFNTKLSALRKNSKEEKR